MKRINYLRSLTLLRLELLSAICGVCVVRWYGRLRAFDSLYIPHYLMLFERRWETPGSDDIQYIYIYMYIYIYTYISIISIYIYNIIIHYITCPSTWHGYSLTLLKARPAGRNLFFLAQRPGMAGTAGTDHLGHPGNLGGGRTLGRFRLGGSEAK